VKVVRVRAYQVDVALERPKRYPHRTYESLDSTVIRLDTDTGLVGWGESCPIGSTYQPEHALGVRAAIEEMAPGLIGVDPTESDRVNAVLNAYLMGSEYAKAAIDVACWDLAGKAYGQPVYRLIGGRLQEDAKAYCAIEYGPAETVPDEMAAYRERGYRHFQVKVGRGGAFDEDIARIRKAAEAIRPGEVLVADANKAWRTHEAIRLLRATEDVDFYVEQPCLTYEECLSVRRRTRQPLILDECMTDLATLLRAIADDAFEGVGCKLTRAGGITGMRVFRDVCVAARKFLTCDDTWGSDLSVAATTHMAVSTPASAFFATYVSTEFSNLRYDESAPAVEDGRIRPREVPGLGVEPDERVLGEPVLEVA
jgi:L-alanine-DL-glutamate epimerase-like enolase superfamily enzyme